MSSWLKKQPHCAYVYEKEGSEEHVHAQIWLSSARTKGNVMKPLKKMLERCYQPDEYIAKVAIVIKPAYNDDFVNEYCQKDGGLEYSNPPPDTVEYYPSEEEQARYLAISENKANWCLWKDLESKWDPERPVNEYTVAEFIAKEMFVNRSIKIEMDGRKRRQMCETFTAVLRKAADGTLFLPKEKHEMYKIFMEEG